MKEREKKKKSIFQISEAKEQARAINNERQIQTGHQTFSITVEEQHQ